MISFLIQIPSETKIKMYLRRMLFGKICSVRLCGSKQIHCSKIDIVAKNVVRPFSLLSGTWLKSMKLSLRTWWALLWCWTQKFPVQQTQKLCHMSEETVYHWFRQFRLRLPYFEPILEGVVQMDEAYFKNLFAHHGKANWQQKNCTSSSLKKFCGQERYYAIFVSAYSTTNKTADGWRRCIQGD